MNLIIPFKPDHLDLMALDPNDINFQRVNWRENIEALASLGLAYTYVVDGRPVLVAGFVFGDPGTATVWMLPSLYITTYALSAARSVKRVLDDIAATHHLYRIESRCPDKEDVARWMQYLGFENPYRCRKAGLGKTDLILWERVI